VGRDRTKGGTRVAAAAVVLFMIAVAAPGPPLAGAEGPTPLATFPYTDRAMVGLETHFLTPPPTADDLHAVAFAPDGHLVLAAGSHNQVLSWDPVTNESRLLNNGTLGVLYGLAWAENSSEALAVGDQGGLFAYGPSGVAALPPENTSATWVGVAWFPGLGYLVVGTGGQAFFLSGSARTPVASPTSLNLLDVAYDPVGDFALAVGDGGAVVRIERTGAATLVPSPVTDRLRGVAFEADTGRALIVGGVGVMLSYAGGTVANETHAAQPSDYWGVAASNSSAPAVVAVANQTEGWVIFHNATADQVVPLGRGLTRGRAIALDARDGSALYAGVAGALVRVWPDGTVANISDAFQPSLRDADWSPDGAEALMVGASGTVFRYDGAADAVSRVPVPDPAAFLTGVSWAPNGTGAILSGVNTLWWYDQASGNLTVLPGASALALYGVEWRPNGTEALVVGASGYLGRWDGTALNPVTTSIFNTLLSLAWHTDASGTGDYAYIVGANVVVVYTPGQGVSTITQGRTFYGVGYEGDDVWIVGNNATRRYDASTGIWETKTLAPAMEAAWLRAVAGRPGADALLLLGDSTFIGYLNASGVNRFYAGYNADYYAADYNPVTGEALVVGSRMLAFTLREGTFPNLAPQVVLSSPPAGANFTTADTIAFDASQSFDPDNDPLTFTWWDNASGFLTRGASFGAQLPEGNHTVTVFVDDGRGHNVSASVSVSVREAMFPPVPVVSAPDANVTWLDDQPITFDASPSYDPNARDTLTFLWTSSVDGVLGNGSVVVRTLTAATHQITLTVTDSSGLSANRTFALSVIPGNRPPVLVVASPSAGVLYHANIPITFDARASSDPDSPSFTVRWVVDGLEVGRGLILNRTVTEGTHQLLVEASDGGKTSSQTIQLTVGPPLNLEPAFEAVLPADGAVLTGLVAFNGTMVDDPAGPVVLVEVQFGQGAAWVPAQGTASWTVDFDTRTVANGAIVISFRAHDAEHTVVLSRAYTVDNPFVNTPPAVSVLTPRAGTTVATLMTLAGTVDDPDGDALTVEWRIANGTWAAVPVTGSTWSVTVDLSGLPNGPTTFEVRGSDGNVTGEAVQLTVIVENPPPPGGFLPGAGAALALLAMAALAAARAGRRRGAR